MTRDPHDNSHLPSWLRDIPLPARPEEGSAQGAPQRREIAPGSSEELPPWLAPDNDSGQGDSGSSAENLPDWLRDQVPSGSTIPAQPTPPVAPTSDQHLPSWLTSMSGSQAETPGQEERADLPDWLRELQPSEPEQPSTPEQDEAAPEPFQFPSQEPEAAAPQAPVETPPPDQAEELPNWLQNISDDDIQRVIDSDAGTGDDELGMSPFSLDDEPIEGDSSGEAPAWLRLETPAEQEDSGSATEWLGANASQLIRGTPNEPGPPSWLQDATPGDAPDETATPDWLHGEPSQPPTPATGDTGVPDWLQDPVQAPAPSGDIPDWLRDSETPAATSATDIPNWLQDSETPATDATASESSAAPPDVPDWLQDASSTSDTAQSMPPWLYEPTPAQSQPDGAPWQDAPEQTEAGASPNMPGWLQEAAATPEPAADAPAGADDEAIPDWLRSAAGQPPTDVGPTPVEPPADTGQVPDWLRAAAEQPPLDTPSDVPAATSADIPAPTGSEGGESLAPWLRDEHGQPLPTAGSPGDTNLPTWLRGIDTNPAPAAQPAEPEPVTPPSLDWFDDEDISTPAVQPSADTSSEILGGAELPVWLRKESEARREQNAADADSLGWLSRIRSQDEDAGAPVTPEITSRLTLPQAPMPSAAQLEALALLQRLAADPMPHTQVSTEAAAPMLSRIGGERVMYLVVLAALLAAMLIPGLSASLQAPLVTPEATRLHEQIAALGPNDIVLLGYEWDAQRISELRPLEQAVLDQLIEQRVKFVLVSTDPQGTLLQFDERDRLRAANYQEGGSDYILLGYRPGSEFALRQLATDLPRTLRYDFQGLDATHGTLATDTATGQPRLNSVKDFAMTIVLADEPNDVQAWMEQVRPSLEKPIAFLIPASVQPLAKPYFRQSDVYYVAGTNGALAYQYVRGNVSPDIANRLGVLRLSTLIICGLLLIGTLIALIQRTTSRRSNS